MWRMIRECAGYGMGGVAEGLISRWGEKAETIWLCAQFAIAMERQRLKQYHKGTLSAFLLSSGTVG